MKVINKVKKLILKIINFIIENKQIIYMSLPLVLIDLITRIFGYNITFYHILGITPNLFTISWIILFIGIVFNTKKQYGKKIYIIINIFYLIIFLINNIYYGVTGSFFDFNLLESASEGSPYILDTVKNANLIIYASVLLIIYFIYKGYKNIPYKTKSNYKNIILVLIIFIVSHALIPLTLGKANKELTWDSWKNPRNIYMSANDSNKTLKVSGLFEYTFRNFYVTYLKTEQQENSEDIEFLNNAFSDYGKYKNKYTSKFKNKNLIFLQLEGIDNWLLTKETTPTLYSLLSNSINFNNHYSYYNGGGSTFNSEFAVNTGFITPLSYTQNAYTFNKNKFPNSMANLFKEQGYSVNAFHMNTGEYYSRTTNYLNWGYDNYYGLLDIKDYEDKLYTLDRELIQNETFNKLLFPEDKPFVDYIITYSVHMPFNNTNGVCKTLYNLENSLLEEIPEFVQLTEIECAKKQAKETDYMVELLLQELKERKILDNTIIVAFTDHYIYTFNDKTIIEKYKDTTNNLINKTPFFIWSKGMKKITIKEPTSQLNILPTVLNLFGLNYNPNNYIGEDALNPKYDGIVFFSDYSWYDGKIYVEDGEITNNKKISKDKLEEKNYYINYITKKNDLALKFNYFKNKK